MSPNNQTHQSSASFLRKIAAALGASGVALGAIGAHAFKETLTKRGTAAIWQTATVYQLFHATAILALANATSCNAITSNNSDKGEYGNSKGGWSKKKTDTTTLLLAGKLLSVGTLLFSGSIYCLALNLGPKVILGPMTPVGGLLMIGGWIMVGLSTD